MSISKFSTIEEAKAYLRENWTEGVECPCCTQDVKLHPHRLGGALASLLIKMYWKNRNTGKDWIHIQSEFNPSNGDYAKLRHWGLIEDRGDIPVPEKKQSGFWRITALGKLFVEGKASVHSHAKLFDSQCHGFQGELVYIQECLGKGFNYQELMHTFVEDPGQPSLL